MLCRSPAHPGVLVGGRDPAVAPCSGCSVSACSAFSPVQGVAKVLATSLRRFSHGAQARSFWGAWHQDVRVSVTLLQTSARAAFHQELPIHPDAVVWVWGARVRRKVPGFGGTGTRGASA